jgi:hypothetical protein
MRRFGSRIIPLILLGFLPGILHGTPPGPGGGGWSFPTNLNSWTFGDTNTWLSDNGYAPVSFTNLTGSRMGDIGGFSLVLDSTNAAWLRFNLMETNGATNLTMQIGTVTMWFAPNWASATTNQNGAGPYAWGRLLEVGSYTTNANYGWWSLFVDGGGTNLHFCAQTNSGDGALTTYLSAPIDWATNVWHMIALTYSATNTALYLDGQLSATGLAVTVFPGPAVRTNGFWIGSDSTGLAQVHGLIDDIFTFDTALDADTILSLYGYFHGGYIINPYNIRSRIASAPASPTYTPTFNAVTGTGYLTAIGTNANCFTNSNVWITNVVVTATNGMRVQFEIAGGADGVMYDIFANSILTFSSDPELAWSWMGRGYHCVTYSLTNLPSTACFILLGTMRDSDYDGLTDAYEQLVSVSDPQNADTDGDGMLDGWEVLWGTNPLSNEVAQSGKRSNYGYDFVGWLNTLSGIRIETVSLDAEGNVQTAQ